MTKLKYIDVKLNNESRKMAVVDGKSYYCSTGHNSGHPNLWFPFLLLHGTKPINYDRFPDYLSKESIKHCGYKHATYIIKFQANYYLPTQGEIFRGLNPNTDLFAIRFPSKETVIVSVQLSGKYFPQDKFDLVDFSLDEKIRITQRIDLEDAPVKTISNPDEVNEWLISQGAEVVSAALSNREEKEIKTQAITEKSPLFFNKTIATDSRKKTTNPAQIITSEILSYCSIS